MIWLGIDPGTTQSAWVIYNTETELPEEHGLESNEAILARWESGHFQFVDRLVVERIVSYGQTIGQTTLDTCVWIGRFLQSWDEPWNPPADLLERRKVTSHMCGKAGAQDKDVRAACVERYGRGDDKVAKGTKANPGPCYGMSKDVWQAFGLVLTAAETLQ